MQILRIERLRAETLATTKVWCVLIEVYPARNNKKGLLEIDFIQEEYRMNRQSPSDG